MNYRKFIRRGSAFLASLIVSLLFVPFVGIVAVYADGTVPGVDCKVRWNIGYFDGYECYIRGIFRPHPTNDSPPWFRITYSTGEYWNFWTWDSTKIAYTNREVIAHVRYNGTSTFDILEFADPGYYNQTPLQPNLVRPQALWQLGPKNNGAYTGVNCSVTGTGEGCSVGFTTITDDPDFDGALTSTFQVTSQQGGNISYTRNNEGQETRTLSVIDGNWQWRGRSCDNYICSAWTGYRSFMVDTTAPSVPVMIAEPAYSGGTQNEVAANPATDNLIGGIQYEFQVSTTADFTENVGTSGWIVASSFIFADLQNEQQYYYRARARDALENTSAWGGAVDSIQDSVAPVIADVGITEQKISPQNADGQSDSTQLSYSYQEVHPDEAKIDVVQIATGTIVNSFVEDISQSPAENPVPKQVVWDGKLADGNFAVDGVYRLDISIRDQAGTVATNADTFVIVDNVPADAGVTNYADGAWVNPENITLNGQTEADAQLKITNTTLSHIVDAVLSPEGLFSEALPIALGENLFTLDTRDNVGNTGSRSYKYYRENVAPQVVSASPKDNYNQKRPVLAFELKDTGSVANEVEYISGLNKDSVFLSLTHPVTGELVLVNNGVNVQPQLGHVEQNCEQPGEYGLATIDLCTYYYKFDQDLQTQGVYTIKFEIQDKASNAAPILTQNFTLDHTAFAEITHPADDAIVNYSLVELKGSAEKGSVLTMELTDVDGIPGADNETFTVSESADNAERVTVSNCRGSQSPEEDGVREICDWSVKDFQLERDTDTPGNLQNTLRLTATDTFGNVTSQDIQINVDLFAVSLQVKAANQYFSPNGDGKQDGVEFVDLATNGQLAYYTLIITDAQGQLVKEFAASSQLPSNIYWDGRSSSGEFVSDGKYYYSLHVTTTDGVDFATPEQELEAVTNLTDRVIITYPTTGAYSTRGVSNVQGQAPLGTQVRICDNVIGMPAECDFQFYAQVTDNGSFSAIIPLIRMPDQESTVHQLTAQAIDKYGNSTPNSNSVQITVVTTTPFDGIEILPALSGVNNEADYQIILDKLESGEEITEEDVMSLRTVILRSRVNQGTERVKLAFASYTDLSELPANAQFHQIGYIDGENKTQLFKDYVDGVTPLQRCTSAGCTWDFYYPVPPTAGGLYEVEFEGKLDVEVEKLTAALLVDGNIPAAPLILDIDKIENGEQLDINLIDNKYYSNQSTNLIRGVSDPSAAIRVIDQNQNEICTTQANAIGLWSCTTDISSLYDLNAQVNLALKVLATLGANTAESIEDKTLVIDTIAPQLTTLQTNQWQRSGNSVELALQANENLRFALHVDSDPFPTGDQCINASVTMPITNWPIQQGKIDELNINGATAGGTFTIHGLAVEGRYCTTLELHDLAGNKIRVPLTFYIDNTAPLKSTIDTSTWGIYNGIETQPGFIAAGRLVPEYTHEEQQFILTGYAEEAQLVELYANGAKVQEAIAATRGQTDGAGNPLCVERTDAQGNPVGDKIADGVMTQSAYDCLYSFIYSFEQGEKGYFFQTLAKDKSLNTSIISEDELIYYDITKPGVPETINGKKADGNTINDWQIAKNRTVTAGALGIGNFGKLPITNSRTIELEDFAEGRSDMIYKMFGPHGQILLNTYKLKDSTGKDKVTYNLTAGDGVYTFTSTATDAPGNTSGEHLLQVELDTVSPGQPRASLNLAGGARPTGINMTVVGEPGSNPTNARSIKLANSGVATYRVKTLDIYNDSDWERTFTFCTRVADRAGNESGSACASIRTPVRPTRPGECEMTPEKQKIFDDISTGNKVLTPGEDIFTAIGFSKSCMTYEANKVQNEVADAQTDLQGRQQSTQSCIQEKLANNVSNADALSQCNASNVLGISTTNNILQDLNTKTDVSSCIQRELEASKKADEAFAACDAGNKLGNDAVNGMREQLKEHDQSVQEKRDYESLSGWEKFVKGVGDGIVNVVNGIINFPATALNFVANTIKASVSLVSNAALAVTSLAQSAVTGTDYHQNFENNKTALQNAAPFIPVNNPIDDLKQLGTAVAVVGVIAVAVAAAPLVATAATVVAGGLATVGVTGALATGLSAAIAFTGAALVTNTVVNVGMAGVQTILSGDLNSFGSHLQSAFCGPVPRGATPDLATCAGYTLGGSLGGEAIGFGIGTAFNQAGKLVSKFDDIAKFADDATDLAKISDEADNLAIASKIDDLGKNTDNLFIASRSDDVIRNSDNALFARSSDDIGDVAAQNKCTGGGCGIFDDAGKELCFAAGTLVKTERGLVPIEKVTVGTKVLARDELTGKVEYKAVLATPITHAEQMVEIKVGSETIVATRKHRFWVENQGWIQATDLKPGMSLINAAGTQDIVVSTNLITDPQPVYNLTVADYHTYFVGENGVWVHNLYEGSSRKVEEAISNTDDFLNYSEEFKGNHLLNEHVNISEGDMLERAMTERLGEPVTKFFSKEDAAFAVKSALDKNKIKIKSWLEGTTTTKPPYRLELPVEYLNRPVGYGFLYKDGLLHTIDNLDSAVVVLFKDRFGGFTIKTGYPLYE